MLELSKVDQVSHENSEMSTEDVFIAVAKFPSWQNWNGKNILGPLQLICLEEGLTSPVFPTRAHLPINGCSFQWSPSGFTQHITGVSPNSSSSRNFFYWCRQTKRLFGVAGVPMWAWACMPICKVCVHKWQYVCMSIYTYVCLPACVCLCALTRVCVHT